MKVRYNFFIFALILCICLAVPIHGSNTCGPSKGLISGLTLNSVYIAPTGTVSNAPLHIEDEIVVVKKTTNSDDFVITGDSQLESGNYREALTAYDQAIKNDPKNVFAWNGKMSALLYLDRYEEVLDAYNQAQKSLPEDYGILINKGRAEFYLNEFDKAIQSADKALLKSPNNVDALIVKADALAIQGTTEAWKYTEQVLNLDPDNVDIWFARGHVLYTKWAEGEIFSDTEYQELIDSLKKDLSYHPDRSCTKKLLQIFLPEYASKLFEDKKYEEIIPVMEILYDVDPEFKNSASYNLIYGISLLEASRYEDAIKTFDEVLQLKPDDAIAWSQKGRALAILGEYQKALEAFETALKYDPNDEQAWSFKGRALQELGEIQKALDAFDQAILLGSKEAENCKNDLITSNSLDEVSVKEKPIPVVNEDYAISKPIFSEFNELSRKEKEQILLDEYLNDISNAWSEKNFNQVVQLSDTALNDFPDNASLWGWKAHAFERLGENKKALEMVNRAISLNSSDQIHWLLKGMIHENMGEFSEAEKAYARWNELLYQE
ncbi:MAG: lipoprotein NlpI [Euryarchaeota archaeon ADurb.Bin294]|nr:MAG: lipoprotein NlpI [Euryarchaeota archaeon ADurb.Bin294]